jgi:hypothetical protein
MFDSASDVMLLGEIPVELSGDSQDSIEEKSQEPPVNECPRLRRTGRWPEMMLPQTGYSRFNASTRRHVESGLYSLKF